MEDSFNVRVGKAFGSLSSSTSTTSKSLSSLWCLTDDEVERREWNRDKGSPEPREEDEFFENFRQKEAIDFHAELEKDLDDLDNQDEAGDSACASSSSTKDGKPDDYNDEEWEIKSSIGRDCTLDYEEEEDAYDKVAVGREKAGDRLYMKDINGYEVDAVCFNELPTRFTDFSRDPRANHIAAKLRLKEDAEAAKKRLEEDAEAAKKIDSLRMSDGDAYANMSAHVSSVEDGNLKSILKRKDTESNPKPQKRVRFDSECKNDSIENSEGSKDVIKEDSSTEEVEAMVLQEVSTLPHDYPSGIPDYMRNPSKYTRYSFDSGDIDDESNKKAYMDFLKMIRRSDATEPQEDDSPCDLTKPVTFIPRKKTKDVIMEESCTESKQILEDSDSGGLPVGIAAGDTNDGVCAMEEDEPQPIVDKRTISQKSGRQYRTKPRSELHE